MGQRNETIVKGVEVQLATVYLLHELDEGANLIRQNKLSAATGESTTSSVHFLHAMLEYLMPCMPSIAQGGWSLSCAWQPRMVRTVLCNVVHKHLARRCMPSIAQGWPLPQ